MISRNEKGQFVKGNVSWSKLHPNYQSGEKHWNWRGGKPKCKDCCIQLGSYKATYCNSCATKNFRKGKSNVHCLQCDRTFHVKPFSIKRGRGKFCSKTCSRIHKKGRFLGNNSPSWKGGKPNCLDCGIKLASYYARRCLMCRVKNEQIKSPTSIEKVVLNELTEMGLIFESQKIINDKFCVDIYILKSNLVIECDGTYWHGLDRIVKKDKSENAYLSKCGYNLLRLTEDEIKNGNFRERIRGQLCA